ncbi:MAG TPA: flagellar filament capping protein FliD [Gammaproteobacteria bacterium]|nr:flagellar filament capping protein FliD [Gammaproteobacteria bacterium]
MSGITSLGVGSGLDLNSLLDALVKSERATAEGPLNRRQFTAESQLSAFGSLKSTAADLADAVAALKQFDVARKATSSNEGVVTATAASTAAPGGYAIEVEQLAAAQSLATSGQDPFTDKEAALGEGALTLTVGGETAAIAIAAGANSLEDVSDAINASGLDVHAAVVRDGDAYRLLLVSGVTGTAGEIAATVDGTLDARLASASMDETTAAQDARFRLNGLELTASSNTIDDVVPGLTLELHGVSAAGDAASLVVGTDVDAVRGALANVVKTYNALVDKIAASSRVVPKDPSSADSSNQQSADGGSGPLVGDSALRALQQRLGAAFSSRTDTDLKDNPFSSLVEIGLHTDASGKASLDEGALEKALETNESGVEALVSAFGASFSETIESYSGPDGILSSRTDQLNAELRRIGQERDSLDARMSVFEDRLQKQFSALDSLVSELKSTSTYLAQQLANLPRPG